MKAIGYAVLAGVAWLWVEQPFALAVAGALAIGGVAGYAYRGLFAAPGPSVGVTEAAEDDADLARLVSMGFREAEIRPMLTKARMKGDGDPVGYVMRTLIR